MTDVLLKKPTFSQGYPEPVEGEVRKLHLRCPVAIVFAYREYEAWFLASMETIARDSGNSFRPDLVYQGDVETRRGVKEWLTHQMPLRQIYKPTLHQAGFTTLIDIDLAKQRSRSFRRLCHAVEEIVHESDDPEEKTEVTPMKKRGGSESSA